ncbi:hypothetical protein BDY19DRAFT_983522 [Irpex rosettiformis]|uniref:Uncharacterized protein n=1 Tax=Irpex rosettiformis TaxID=378272 RepID=A0ACB8UCG3_9APHY|nr:hypothetical protein BDY19DRAFT_983522 [Irpex rosettiformis]
MSTVVDVSSVLGEYMLKGWILSDDICKKCSKVPLLRSKSSPPRQFCANCDGGPVPASSTSASLSQHSSSSADSVSQCASRPSTPPTEVSTTLSSPTFAPPMDMEEITRRRQQSDLASAEIGKLLLKGWAMLADECPNNTCYGIPLVRPPRINGGLNPHKECVVCHTVYVDRPGGGLERLQPSQALENPPELPTHEINRGESATRTPLSLGVAADGRTFSSDRGAMDGLQATVNTLEHTLEGLTERLNFLSSGQAFEVTTIGSTADAISKVTQALMKVKELQWSEQQASQS